MDHDPWLVEHGGYPQHQPGQLDRYRVRDLIDGWGRDQRLIVQVHVDGRLVDSWTASVEGSAWQEVADRYAEAQHHVIREPSPPPPPADPVHVRVLRWLEGVVGGQRALLELTDRDSLPVEAPELEGAPLAEAYGSAADHLDRVCTKYFNEDVHQTCERLLGRIVVAEPRLSATLAGQELAAAVLWLVGRANNLFAGGVSQQTIARELWLKKNLSTCGGRFKHLVRGIDVHDEPRPGHVPVLTTYGNPDLLTQATRRELIRWRDEALTARERAREAVLPAEVE